MNNILACLGKMLRYTQEIELLEIVPRVKRAAAHLLVVVAHGAEDVPTDPVLLARLLGATSPLAPADYSGA